MSDRRPKLKWVPLSFLFVDERYQRELHNDRLRRMTVEFDPTRLTPLTVSKRSDTQYAIILGQHRYEMLAALGWRTAPSMVHEGLTPQEESELFDREKADRQELSQLDVWKSELFRREEPTFTINTIVEEEGFAIRNSTYPDAIRAVGSLRRIYTRHGAEGLRTVLRAIAPWESMPRGRDGHLLEGIALFLATADPTVVDTRRLREVIAREDPTALSTRAASRQRTMGGAGMRTAAVRDELLNLYNKGLRTRRLHLASYDLPHDGEDAGEEEVG